MCDSIIYLHHYDGQKLGYLSDKEDQGSQDENPQHENVKIGGW